MFFLFRITTKHNTDLSLKHCTNILKKYLTTADDDYKVHNNTCAIIAKSEPKTNKNNNKETNKNMSVCNQLSKTSGIITAKAIA